MLIGPGIVLTAMHVVLGDQRPEVVEEDVSVEVRVRANVLEAVVPNSQDWGPDFAALARNPAMHWRSARLIWPAAGADPYAHDVALLQIADWESSQSSPAAGSMTLAARARKTGFIAYGFPRFKNVSSDGQTLWRGHTAFGNVRGDEIADPGIRTRPLNLDSVPPGEAAGWQGMSGAVLLVDNESYAQIIGVVHARVDGTHDNSELEYWPLDAIPRDDPFWTLSGILRPGAALQPPGRRPSQSPASALRERFYEFDRGLESGVLRRWLTGDPPGAAPRYKRAGPPTRPAVIVLCGHAIDEPIMCLTRFANLIATLAFAKYGDNYRYPLTMRCGPYQSSPENRFQRILVEWAERYADKEPALGADLEKIIIDGLRSKDRPRLIGLEHNTDQFVEGCSMVADKVLALVSRAWEGVPDSEPPPVVILCLITGQKAGLPDAAFLPADPYPDKQERFAVELKKIQARHPGLDWCTEIDPLDVEPATAEDFDDWLRAMAAQGLPVPPGVGDAIRINLGNVDQFRMRYAKSAADHTLIPLAEVET